MDLHTDYSNHKNISLIPVTSKSLALGIPRRLRNTCDEETREEGIEFRAGHMYINICC